MDQWISVDITCGHEEFLTLNRLGFVCPADAETTVWMDGLAVTNEEYLGG